MALDIYKITSKMWENDKIPQNYKPYLEKLILEGLALRHVYVDDNTIVVPGCWNGERNKEAVRYAFGEGLGMFLISSEMVTFANNGRLYDDICIKILSKLDT